MESNLAVTKGTKRKAAFMNLLRKTLFSLVATLIYIGIYYILHLFINPLSNMTLWRRVDFIVQFGIYRFSFYDFLHFLVGLLLFVFGIVRLDGITIQNHSAQDRQTRKPVKLLTDGYYEKVRHPMYGTFMTIYFGILFSLRSLIGVVIFILFFIIQYFNGIFEEHRELSNIFGDEYKEYSRIVKSRYLTSFMKMYFILAGCLIILGILFM